MSAIASWVRSHLPEVAWGAFAAINFAVLVELVDFETVPFHFVWVSLTLLYGFRVWGLTATLAVLAAVCVASTVTLGYVVTHGPQGIDELTEVPLMSAMFLAMVWHARRRQTALDEVRRSAERERDFLRDASHHLKTPIAIARGMAELIRRNETSIAQRELDVLELLDELDRLGDIAGELLLLASAEQPGSMVLAPVDVEDLVVGVARRWSRTVARAWRVDVEVDGFVQGDREKLDAALDAVVDNAVFATETNGVVALGVHAEGTDAVVEVRDSGTGIPPEVLPQVFDRFASFRDERRRGRGTGLGLPIARAIAEAHEGTIAVTSAPGEGTTVTFRLPGLVVAGQLGAAQPFRLRRAA